MSDSPAAGTATPAPKTSRAGRDLPAAIGVSLVLVAVLLASLLIRKEAFLVIVVAAMWVGLWELTQAVRHAGIDLPMIPLAIGAVSMVGGAYFRGPEALVLTFGLTCVGALLWRAADGLDGALKDVAGAFFVALYPCLFGGFAALLLAMPDGQLRVIYFILVTAFSDIGGYAVGVLFGKHPIAPSISPKKSWEGFAGSVLTCAVVGALGLVLLLDGPWWKGAIIGAFVACAATTGDLVESCIKRDLGIKDMSTLLPGHGGLMDRLDSLVLCIPVVWALLLWV